MRIIDCEQGTEEWLQARLGCPTGSGYAKLITATGTASTQAETYINQLIAETLTGTIPETYSNEYMQRGTELEPICP
jgi:hypothetical protein